MDKKPSDPIVSKSINIQSYLSIPQQEYDNLFKRLKKALRGLFRKHDPNLAGRINDLRDRADRIYSKLVILRQEMQKHPSLIPFAEGVIRPLIMEADRIRGKTVEQVKFYNRYQEWIDRSKIWIDRFKYGTDEELAAALIEHVISETLQQIDRDLQIIKDYQHDHFDNLKIPLERVSGIRKELAEEVGRHEEALRALAHPPDDIQMEHLNDWKKLVDLERQKHFELALQAIDAAMMKHAHDAPSFEEEHSHLLEIFEQIGALEKMVPQIANIIHNESLIDSQKESLREQIAHLEKEADHLSLDLRLPEKYVERLSEICLALKKARSLI